MSDSYDYEPVSSPLASSSPLSRSRRRGTDLANSSRWSSSVSRVLCRSWVVPLSILVAFGLGLFAGLHAPPVATNVVEDATATRMVSPRARAGGASETRPDDTTALLGAMAKEDALLKSRLRRYFGEHRSLLFDPVVTEKVFTTDSSLSRDRLRRRLTTKLLEAATSSSSSSTRLVWAVAGDAAAAGHGNLRAQSYARVAEDTARASFAAVGVELEVRDYGMGGYRSAPELALCAEAVYGEDVDLLAWDFSASGSDPHHAALFAHRAGVHPSAPVVLVMDDDEDDARWEAVAAVERAGLGAVRVRSRHAELLRRIPVTGRVDPNDVNEHRLRRNEALPHALKRLRCDEDYTVLEGGPCGSPNDHDEDQHNDPHPVRPQHCDHHARSCRRDKFATSEYCVDARHQNDVHPGWKAHFLKGTLSGLFLVDALRDALADLDDLVETRRQRNDPLDLAAYLDELLAQRDADRAAFRASPVPPDALRAWPLPPAVAARAPELLFRADTICHTALFPSQTRYQGVLTETTPTPDRPYDRGTNKIFLRPPDDGVAPLVFDPNDRQKCTALELDHKDFFYVRSDDGWLSLTLPNDAEARRHRDYHPDTASAPLLPHGLVLVCPRVCAGRCSDEAVGLDNVRKSVLSAAVDGAPVTGATPLERCHFLERDDGEVSWPGRRRRNGHDDDPRYDLRFRVDEKTGKWLKISSVVLF